MMIDIFNIHYLFFQQQLFKTNLSFPCTYQSEHQEGRVLSVICMKYMIIDINIFMHRKTHHSVERCDPNHTLHQPHIIITNHVHPPNPPPAMTIANTHVQHYKPSSYLQPPKAPPGALSKSMVFMQQGHPSRAGQ
jgi:hypothetical protein